MQYFLQVLAYLFQFVFLCAFLALIIKAVVRQIKVKANYDAGRDELLIEFRCLTATKQKWPACVNVNLGQGTYSMGTSPFSELRITNTGTHFAGTLEVHDDGECHLYINKGTIHMHGEPIDENHSSYISMYPGDVFTIGKQTYMINELTPEMITDVTDDEY